MNCEVITYTNPKALDQLESFHPYIDCLHVCATKNMREGVYQRYQKQKLVIKAPVVSAVQLMESLLGGWYSAETKLKQYLHLSEIIQEHNQDGGNLAASFRRNQIEVLETIRMLEVSGMTAESLDDDELELTKKEIIFLKIWKEFQGDQSIRRIRGLLSNGFQDRLKEKWVTRVRGLIEDAYKENDEVLQRINYSVGYETIVLHGFYFMTPEQQQIFQLMKDAGVKIVFLNLYDGRFPQSFSFIEKFINERHGWIDKKAWKMEKWEGKRATLADKFLYDFEGEQLGEFQNPSHLIVRDFKDFYEFLEDYEQNIELESKFKSKTYLAPNAEALNDRLQEYYPELFKTKRHFLGYPIGQFLYQLHQMWSEEEATLIMTGNSVFECFASGWLYDEKTGKNAREYTKALHEVLPFFQGCVTQKSWARRAAELLAIHEQVLPPFKEEGDDRFEEMMSSPFARFSQFAIPMEDVKQLVSFMGMIFKISSELFGDGSKRISLADHFTKLRKLMGDSNPYLQHQMLKEEEELICELKKSLQTTPDIGDFRVNDISTAISLYLSGHLRKDHAGEDEVIRPFIEIDGEVFKENGITHVTGLDENSLPYSEFKLPWPLTEHVFLDLAKRNVPLSFQVLRNQHVKEITRYLIYNLLQFSERLELSWMVQYEDKKNLDKAVYLSQLNLEPKPNQDGDSGLEQWADVKLDKDVTKQELDAFLAYPIDALAEFKFCPRRFYYSYMTGGAVSFQSEFVQQFLFGNLLKSIGALLPNVSDVKIKEQVYQLFPYWDELKLNMIGEENIAFRNWAKKHYGGHTPYGEGRFSDLRKLFLFPVLNNNKADDDSKAVAAAIEQLYSRPGEFLPGLREDFERQLQSFPIQMEATPSGKCRYCPHNQYCADAFHPVDDAERKRAK